MENQTLWKKVGIYVGFILGTLLIGGLAGFLIRDSMETYASLNQPPLAPPGNVFPIVWGVLYLLMGISAARVFLTGKDGRRSALVLYGVQLAFNFVWSLIFFNVQMFLAAFLWLLVLWILIAIMIYVFWKLDRPAGLLQIPYLAWVTFAGYLNCAIWILNP